MIFLALKETPTGLDFRARSYPTLRLGADVAFDHLDLIRLRPGTPLAGAQVRLEEVNRGQPHRHRRDPHRRDA